LGPGLWQKTHSQVHRLTPSELPGSRGQPCWRPAKFVFRLHVPGGGGWGIVGLCLCYLGTQRSRRWVVWLAKAVLDKTTMAWPMWPACVPRWANW
jgi:hypothetical protein